MIYFFQIVVLGRQPEHGNGVRPFFGQLASDMDRRQRLVNRIGGAAEQSDLLPGYDGDGSITQAVQISIRFPVREQCVVLGAQLVHNAAANHVIGTNLSDGLSNTGEIRRMGVKLGNAGKIAEIRGV